MMLCLPSAAGADLSWFEGHWKWNRPATIEAMSRGSEVDREATEKNLTDDDGELLVDSGTITIIDDDGTVTGPFEFATRPIEVDRFEMMFEAEDIISRISAGFCTRWGGDYSKPPMREGYESCYSRSAE